MDRYPRRSVYIILVQSTLQYRHNYGEKRRKGSGKKKEKRIREQEKAVRPLGVFTFTLPIVPSNRNMLHHQSMYSHPRGFSIQKSINGVGDTTCSHPSSSVTPFPFSLSLFASTLLLNKISLTNEVSVLTLRLFVCWEDGKLNRKSLFEYT